MIGCPHQRNKGRTLLLFPLEAKVGKRALLFYQKANALRLPKRRPQSDGTPGLVPRDEHQVFAGRQILATAERQAPALWGRMWIKNKALGSENPGPRW
jgi:hypothetical protein